MTHTPEAKDAFGSKVSVFVQTYAGRMSFYRTKRFIVIYFILISVIFL
jgi:hypothetical protein